MFYLTLLALCWLIAYPALAQPPVKPPQQRSGDQTTQVPAVVEPAEQPGLVTWGTVESLSDGRLRIKSANGEVTEFQLTENTKYVGLSRQDIKKGTEISLQHGPNDKVVNTIGPKETKQSPH